MCLDRTKDSTMIWTSCCPSKFDLINILFVLSGNRLRLCKESCPEGRRFKDSRTSTPLHQLSLNLQKPADRAPEHQGTVWLFCKCVRKLPLPAACPTGDRWLEANRDLSQVPTQHAYRATHELGQGEVFRHAKCLVGETQTADTVQSKQSHLLAQMAKSYQFPVPFAQGQAVGINLSDCHLVTRENEVVHLYGFPCPRSSQQRFPGSSTVIAARI